MLSRKHEISNLWMAGPLPGRPTSTGTGCIHQFIVWMVFLVPVLLQVPLQFFNRCMYFLHLTMLQYLPVPIRLHSGGTGIGTVTGNYTGDGTGTAYLY